jgi:mono/diheme cytochrome c family protein
MRFLGGVLVGVLVALAAAGLFLWSGAFNVAATQPPGRLEKAVARYAVDRSIARRASGAKNPLSSSPEVLREGLSHYRENCLGCHGAPGVDAAEYGQGLNPAAPDLTLPRVQENPDGQLYWIVANGIRMTGMPAFAPTHREEEIWMIVAFLRHLPEISAAEEKELKARSEAGQHHHETSGEPTAEAANPAHVHPPGTKPHKD